MITKKQAHLLAAYEFNMVDKENIEYYIVCVHAGHAIKIGKSKDNSYPLEWVDFKKIGVDYFILCRPYSQLTEEIEHGGYRFVPLVNIGYVNYELAYHQVISKIKTDIIQNYENDMLLTWNFKPQWLDEKFVKYIDNN